MFQSLGLALKALTPHSLDRPITKKLIPMGLAWRESSNPQSLDRCPRAQEVRSLTRYPSSVVFPPLRYETDKNEIACRIEAAK